MDQELIARLDSGEDNFVERKPDGVKRGEIRETIVAFANSVPEGRTGVLYIGVRDDGTVQGVSNPDKLQKTIQTICEKDCYPPIVPRCEILVDQGRSVIAVVISESKSRPHFSGPAYIREGSKTVAASEKLFNELIASRLSKTYEILKWRNQLVTVVARRKKLGKTENLHDSSYHATHECRVEDCTAHWVSLYDLNEREYLSEPLSNVTLARDERKWRLMLIVEERTSY